ncbi:putative Dihydroxyacetone phosphatase [Paratrimastix pyriformis]|uniref:Dihydroxyacetone phosphatase n=1 Tax=Paratrimastix pyriformis TaxID=342808 RepID=A0ABQ8UMI4_9EUKA|nr:putative Dihydroxyacetone phosphatase [Paratrimastix pyriformis]
MQELAMQPPRESGALSPPIYSVATIRAKEAFIIDMDGVIYHGNQLLPRVSEFLRWLVKEEKRFVFLTNSSERSPKELSQKMKRLGITVGEDHFYTSALSTAGFLASQKPGGTCFVIGEAGLTQALYAAGFSMNEVDPDFVVVGDTRSFGYEKLVRAIQAVKKGAKLICTNPDISMVGEGGMHPATGALVAPIELVTGKKAYTLGKPNPLMMRQALKMLKARREDTVIIGDRMDTDIIAGIESEITTCLVLSGVTSREELDQFAYQPSIILDGIADILPPPSRPASPVRGGPQTLK